MIKLTKPPVEMLNEEGEKTGCLSCAGEVDGYIFYCVIPPEHTTDKDTVQAYLETYEPKIKAGALAEDSQRAKERFDILAPTSEHIGKLISVNTSVAKPATIRRKYMGETYDVSCFVTQSVKDQFQAGDIQINDYVLVSFIDENPNGTEKNVAILTDKVYKSW